MVDHPRIQLYSREKIAILLKPFRSRKRSSSDSLASFGLLFYSFAHETNFRPEDCQLITITKQIETVGLPKPSYMTSNIAESKFPRTFRISRVRTAADPPIRVRLQLVKFSRSLALPNIVLSFTSYYSFRSRHHAVCIQAMSS